MLNLYKGNLFSFKKSHNIIFINLTAFNYILKYGLEMTILTDQVNID